MNKFLAQIIKLSGLPAQHFYFKRKVYCEGNNKKLKKIKQPALIVSNHTSVYDYPLIMYTFYSKNLCTLVGETMYTHSKFLNFLLNSLGAIKVDRKNFDFSFMSEMSAALKKNQIGLIFPESRLHTEKDPQGLIDFKPSYVYIALKNNVPIIPVYTNGIYGKLKKQNKDRARIIIGNWIYPNKLYDKNKTESENINFINDYVKQYIIKLSNILKDMK